MGFKRVNAFVNTCKNTSQEPSNKIQRITSNNYDLQHSPNTSTNCSSNQIITCLTRNNIKVQVSFDVLMVCETFKTAFEKMEHNSDLQFFDARMISEVILRKIVKFIQQTKGKFLCVLELPI